MAKDEKPSVRILVPHSPGKDDANGAARRVGSTGKRDAGMGDAGPSRAKLRASILSGTGESFCANEVHK